MTALTDVDLVIAAAAAGAAQVRHRYGGPLTRHAKEGTDFATSADLASEQAIRELLAEHRPGDAMVGEEGGRTGAADATREWLVDPLCGTHNYAATTALFAVNVALRQDGRVLAAASADPSAGEVFWTDGAAAYVRRDGVDSPASPSATSLLVDLDLDPDDARGGVAVDLFGTASFRSEFRPRVSGTTLALTWLAAGRRAGYVQAGDLRDNVHLAAPIAVAQAAGCVVTGVHGQPLHTGVGGLLAAADAATHARLLTMLTNGTSVG